jgi:hypothetical protein
LKPKLEIKTMKNTMLIDASKLVIKFMNERGWRDYICDSCGKLFFSKSTNDIKKVCGWNKCELKGYPFRTLMKKKKMITTSEINTRMREYFNSVGFKPTEPLNIANSDGQTDLVIAGVQVFDEIIHQNKPIRDDQLFIAQPCVRMQFQQHVESQEGLSTSFVNVCTEKMNSTFDEHLKAVDHWFTILSKIGLHMNDFIIVMKMSENDWGTGRFSSIELFFSYGGLELGDAAYLHIPQLNRDPIPISDIGFGLERITWAINKTDSYFEMLTPLSLSGTREMFDFCRTLALLISCGVQAKNKGPGLQLRRFAKVISEKYYGEDIYSVLNYYMDYWSKFIKPSVDHDTAIRLVRLEIDRLINLEICKCLKLTPPCNETTEDYLNRLVYQYCVDIPKLREVIKKYKK